MFGNDASDRCVAFDPYAESARLGGHRLRDRAHAADGVAPHAAMAVHFADHVVQQHISRARRIRAGEVADNGVKAEHRLDRIGLEPRIEHVARKHGLGAEVETDPRFADNDARVRNREALRALVEARLAQRTTAQWQPLLEARDIMCAPVADYAWVTGSEQFQHVGAAVSMDLPSGARFQVPGFLMGDRSAQARVRYAPPSIGQHSREILEELFRRAGERSRSPEELDYLNRLLRRF